MEIKNIVVTQEPSNAFARLLCQFRDGASQSELSEKLQELVAAVQETGKSGTLTFTIKVRPEGNAIVVTDDIKSKFPTLTRDGAVFFAADDNTLHRENPKQKTLDLREVAKPAPAPIKEVSSPAADNTPLRVAQA